MKYQGKKIKSLVSVSDESNTAQMQLYGVIGRDVNGNQFANDIIEVARFGFAEVKININSVGGSIFQGFSIINAMNVLRTGGTVVSTCGVGVMDSMAGIILAFGDRGKRTATSFSSGIVHEPLFEDDNGNLIKIDDLPDGTLKSEAVFMREALLTSLENSTGLSRKDLKRIMSEGTRRDAATLKALGMIDSVIIASNTVDLQNLSPVELMAACSKLVISQKISNKNSKTMTLINSKLGLNTEASESAQAEAVQKIIDRADAAEAKAAKVDEKDIEIQNLKNLNKDLKDKAEAAAAAAVESFVNQQIDAGKFKKDDKDKLVAQATANFDGFKTICESLNGNFVDVTQSIDKTKAAGGSSKNDQLLNEAKEYHAADVDGALLAFKNKVGAEKFAVIEDFYTENIDKVIGED